MNNSSSELFCFGVVSIASQFIQTVLDELTIARSKKIKNKKNTECSKSLNLHTVYETGFCDD